MKQSILALATAAIIAAGCTAIKVDPIPRDAIGPGPICIEQNPKVVIRDFLPAVTEGFARHGIPTEVRTGLMPAHCQAVLSYTARQSWDLASYLSTADIEIWKNGQRIAHAHYHLRGKGGYALTKYQGSSTKMKPVMDQLLQNYRPAAAGPNEDTAPSGSGSAAQK